MKVLNAISRMFAGLFLPAILPLTLSAQYDFKWQTDGTVNAAVIKDNVLYIGGQFSYVGKYSGTFLGLDPVSGERNSSWPTINNSVFKIINDGSGGWFVCGYFDNVGGITRRNIVRLRPDKTVDPAWNIGADGVVYTMKIVGNTLFIAGNFTTVGGQSRNRLAAIDIPSATVTAWNPGANGDVKCLEAFGSMLYVGGQFTIVGGQSRRKLAAVDIATGSVAPFDAGLVDDLNEVRDLYLSGNSLYIGGTFLVVGGMTRHNLAAIDITTGLVTSWDPRPNGGVTKIQAYADKLYVSGKFTMITGIVRRRIASFDAATGTLTSWNPNSNGEVTDFCLDGNLIYACGQFTSIGGQTRRKVAALETNSNNATSWDPNPGNGWEAFTIMPAAGNLLLGGSFTSVNGSYRNNLAAIDLATNALLPWNPSTNGIVYSICISDDGTVYAGGDFTTVAGLPRNRIVAIDATGVPTAWNPGANLTVRTLAAFGSTIYAGGDFTVIGGLSRPKLAALDATVATNSALPWNPAPNAMVRTIVTDGTYLFVGGDFTNIAGSLRGRIAGFDIATHTLEPWTADANNSILTACYANGTLYLGGQFTSIAGQPRNRIAAISAGGSLTGWDPGNASAISSINGIAVTGSVVYVAGSFTSIGGSARQNLAALDAGTNVNNSILWSPFPNPFNGFNCIVVRGHNVYVGGGFNTAGSALDFYLTYIPSLSALGEHTNQFTVTARGNNCVIKWNANDAGDDVGFQVQRSTDGNSFVTISTRIWTGQDAYEEIDRNLNNGKYFYRLRITGKGGMVYFSSSVAVSIGSNTGQSVATVRTYDNSLSILLRKGKAFLTLSGSDGRVIMRRTISTGTHSIALSTMVPGIYYYSLSSETGERLSTGRIFVR